MGLGSSTAQPPCAILLPNQNFYHVKTTTSKRVSVITYLFLVIKYAINGCFNKIGWDFTFVNNLELSTFYRKKLANAPFCEVLITY